MPNLVRRLDYEADFADALRSIGPFVRQQLEGVQSAAQDLPRSFFSGLRKRLRTLLTPIVEQVSTDTAFVMDDQVNGNLDSDLLVNVAANGSPKMADQFAGDFVDALQKQAERQQEEDTAAAVLATYLLSIDALTQPGAVQRRAIEYVVETMTNTETAVADMVNAELVRQFTNVQSDPNESIEALLEGEQGVTFQVQDYLDPADYIDPAEIMLEITREPIESDIRFTVDNIFDEIDVAADDYTPRPGTPQPPYQPAYQIIETTETDRLPPLPNQYRPSQEAIEIAEIEPDLADYQDAFEAYLDEQKQQGKEEETQPPKLVPIWRTQEDARVCKTCDPLNGLPQPEWPAWVGSGPQAHPNCRCFLEWAYYVNGQPLQR